MRSQIVTSNVPETHADLARKLEALEKKYDTQFKAVFDAIRELMARRRRAPRAVRLRPRAGSKPRTMRWVSCGRETR